MAQSSDESTPAYHAGHRHTYIRQTTAPLLTPALEDICQDSSGIQRIWQGPESHAAACGLSGSGLCVLGCVYLNGELVHVVLQVLEAEVEVPRVVRRLQHATAPARAPDASARPQAV